VTLAPLRNAVLAAQRKPPPGYTAEELAAIAASVGKTSAELDITALDRFALRYRVALRADEMADVAVSAVRERIQQARGHLTKALTALGYDQRGEETGDDMRRLLAAAGDDELPVTLAHLDDMLGEALLTLARLDDVLGEALAILYRPDDPVLLALRGFPTPNLALDVLITEGVALYTALTARRPGFSIDPATQAVGGPFVRFLQALASPYGRVPSAEAMRKRWRNLSTSQR
jgi:hypothetical protein